MGKFDLDCKISWEATEDKLTVSTSREKVQKVGVKLFKWKSRVFRKWFSSALYNRQLQREETKYALKCLERRDLCSENEHECWKSDVWSIMVETKIQHCFHPYLNGLYFKHRLRINSFSFLPSLTLKYKLFCLVITYVSFLDGVWDYDSL